MAVNQLSNGEPDGNSFGQSAADLISFHGATPVVQAATIAAATDAATAISQLNLLLVVCRAKGLIAT